MKVARSTRVVSLHVDTHVVIWLFENAPEHMSAKAMAAVEGQALAYSPLVSLELTYLFQRGRIQHDADFILSRLAAEHGLAPDHSPLSEIIQAAQGLAWTRDVFDRLIVAQSMVAGSSLVTADRLIREHYPAAIW